MKNEQLARLPAVAAGAGPVLILILAALVSPGINYNRWDNFEFYTPNIFVAHSRWLQGELPRINDHQFLGLPILGTMQAGALYIPYTFCYLLIQTFGFPASWFAFFSVLFHSALAAVGWYRLLRGNGVRPLIAVLSSWSAPLAGFFTVMSSLWMFMAPVLAWLPWLMSATLDILSGKDLRRSRLLFVLALTATFYVGHPQAAIYSCIFLVCLVAVYSVFVIRSARYLPALISSGLIGAFLATPFLLPGFLYLSNVDRTKNFEKAEFLSRSLSYPDVVTMLAPLYQLPRVFLPGFSVHLYQGSWVVAALIAGVVATLLTSRLRSNDQPADHEHTRRLFWSVLGLGLFFLALALGRYGLLLPLTYGLPIWSSFRWPFKFAPFFLVSILFAAALGWEMWWRQECLGRFWQRWIPWAVVGLAVLVFIANLLLLTVDTLPYIPEMRSTARYALGHWSGWAATITGLALAILIAPRPGRRSVYALCSLMAVHWIAFIIYCHRDPTHKSYEHRLASAAAIGADVRYRVLPASHWDERGPDPGEYGLFNSAGLGGWYSATGCESTGFLPRWYMAVLQPNVEGMIALPGLRDLVATDLARRLNIRYYIAAKTDGNVLAVLSAAPALRVLRELPHTVVFEDPSAFPRAFFSGKQQAGRGGEVSIGRFQNGIIDASVNTAEGGDLILSQLWTPGWSARIDGNPAPVTRTNEAMILITVPAGAKNVHLEYDPPGFRLGLVLAGIGCVGLLGLTLWRRPPATSQAG